MMKNKEHKKNGRVVWSEELHHKFVVAVNLLGIDKAVPKKILALMNDEKLTKENVASHLQKYRLQLKRISSNCVPNQKGSLIGSGQFHYNAAAAAAQNVSPNQFGHTQNSNNTTIDHVYQNSAVQAMPISEWYSNQSPDSLANYVPFQWWDDHNQDAIYHSNVIRTSINSLTPLKGAVDPKCHTSTNSTFNTNLDFNFCDPLQMKHDGNKIMELTAGNSLKQQHKSQNTCIANNLGFIEGLVTAASSSCSSQESAEIAELRQEMTAIRNENHQLREIIQSMKAQQDMLMQAVLQVVPPNALTQQ